MSIEKANQINPVRARQIMHSYKPRGWKIKMGGAHQRGASGLCDYDSRTIFVPLVCDDYSLFVYLHEVGHVRLHTRSKKPGHVTEYEAEAYARRMLRACGFRVTRTMLVAGKRYVANVIKMDQINGLPIDPVVRRWALPKSLRSDTGTAASSRKRKRT